MGGARARAAIAGAIAALMVTPFAVAVGPPDAPRTAVYVAHASTPAAGSAGFELTCSASGTISGTLIASAADDGSDRWDARVRASFNGGSGHLVQVAGHEVVWQERVGGQGESGTGFTLFSSVNGPASGYTARFAWALWGSAATCSLTVGSASVPVTVADDALARSVPPTAFSHGPYYSDGTRTVAAGRIYGTPTPGGALFAAMSTGSDGLDAAGVFVTAGPAGPQADVCERPRFFHCNRFAVRAATHLTVAATAIEAGGGDPGELWFLALGPDAFA